ncbi:DUF1624 domain-containing protein [Mesorhizobium sp. LNJC391B00]|uniref:DUF1624 domain-containing protein n=1 Tax=Mesorhizobium sp. LNJC391B00 TaxID=1287273 RepID=UPI0003CF3B12|nr:DUF1624 domain-containing protein [Mesorhizobium sp. LNJC391B00]ESY32434.1 hypothetical protein X749_04555 [Mesorhizobium sp. LNJC391B00]
MSIHTAPPGDQLKRDQPKRIVAIDVVRGIALIAMASYHFTWDLENFHYTDPGLTAVGWWKIYARCIASTFLFLVGVSLFLAHGRQIRWTGFWKRFAMVAVAAAAISAVTYFITPDSFIFFGILHQIALASLLGLLFLTPDSFIFFGILHQIALASLLGLLFLRLPSWLTLVVAAVVIAGPIYFRSEAFDHPALWWVGLSAINPRSNDYVPLFPWFGAVLLGIAAAKFASTTGLLARLATLASGSWTRPLTFIGRHSLAFYLIHQPLLFGCVWLFSQIAPAPVETREVVFLKECQVSCEQQRDTEFCTSYCVCMLDTLQSEAAFDRLYNGDQTPEFKAHLGELASICTAKTEESPMTQGGQQ